MLHNTNPGYCQVLLGVAKVEVLVEGLTSQDLGGESESRCGQMLSTRVWVEGSGKVKFYLVVRGFDNIILLCFVTATQININWILGLVLINI